MSPLASTRRNRKKMIAFEDNLLAPLEVERSFTPLKFQKLDQTRVKEQGKWIENRQARRALRAYEPSWWLVQWLHLTR